MERFQFAQIIIFIFSQSVVILGLAYEEFIVSIKIISE